MAADSFFVYALNVPFFPSYSPTLYSFFFQPLHRVLYSLRYSPFYNTV